MDDSDNNLLTGNEQADFLNPETATDTEAAQFSTREKQATFDRVMGGGKDATNSSKTEPVARVNQNRNDAKRLADTRQQLESLAAGVPHTESKDTERTLAQANTHIIRYGDPRLDQALNDWIKPDEDIHARVFPTFSNGESAVTLVGTAHAYKTEKPMIKDVISTTKGYLDTTPPEKRMVMIEGIHGGTIPDWQDLNSAVASHGEMGAAGFVTQEAGAEVVSPEAPQSEVIDTLKQAGIPADKIAAFYTLRSLPRLMRQGQATPDNVASLVYGYSQEAGTGWVQPFSEEDMRRMVIDPEFGHAKTQTVLEAAVPKLNASMKDTITNWYQAQDAETKAKIVAGTISSKEVEQKVYRELLTVGESLAQDENAEIFRLGDNGVEIRLDADTISALTLSSSEAPETDLRAISRIDNETRDEYLLKSIDAAVKSGKNPLVIFGGAHAIKIAPALSAMFPNEEQKIAQTVEQAAKEVGIEPEQSEVIDLTHLSNEEVMSFFGKLMQSGDIVLHGSNSESPFDEIKPNKIDGAPLDSQNQNAIYAATTKESVLVRSVINRPWLIETGGYSLGETVENDRKIFHADPRTFNLIQNKDPNVLSDGWVYILNKSNFQAIPEDPTEFASLEPSTPIAVCKVSRQLSEALFVIGQGKDKDTLFPYTDEDRAKARPEYKQFADLLPERDSYTGTDLVEVLQDLPEYQDRMKDPHLAAFIAEASGLHTPMDRDALLVRLIGLLDKTSQSA